MTRRWMVALLLLLAAVSVPAAYKIYLVNGKVITADDKPVLRDGIAYFQKSGMDLYLPVDQIDLVKTEKGGGAALTAAPVEQPGPGKAATRKIGEEQLDEIRRRSRLANEGELQQPIYAGEEGAEGQEGGEGAAPPAGGAAPAAGAGGERSSVQNQLSSLLNQRASVQKQLVDLQGQQSNLRGRYDTSTSQAEKESLQSQLDAVQSQIDSTRSQLTSVEANLQDTQQKLASMPVVVQQ